MTDDRARMLTDIADTADALTDSYTHIEPIHTTDRHRNRRLTHLHTVRLPGLLTQLHDLFEPGATQDDNARAIPASKPPLNLEAINTHTVIVLAVTRWCWSLQINLRDTVESNIRALVGASATLDSDTQAALLTELHTWHRRAAILTRWQTPPYRPAATCPHCGSRNTIVVNLDRREAFCNGSNAGESCGAWWDPGTIGVLADHVRLETSAA
jgi:hypothetical protein